MKQTLVTLISILFLAGTAGSASASTASEKKQLAKAESLVTRLEHFDAFVKTGPGFNEYRARLENLSPEIYKRASNLEEGNTKTDLLTAVRFYELAARGWNDTDSSHGPICSSEKPGAYQRLCQSGSHSRRNLLLAKARLHLAWATASMNSQLNRPQNAAMLSEIQLERISDELLARDATRILRSLANEVIVHQSLGDFQDSRVLARVSYEDFRKKLGETSIEVEKILSWLPQNRLKFEIRNALHSYQDGALWWSRSYQPKTVNVSELNFTATTFVPSGAYQDSVPYIVAINWRQAAKYLERAERMLSGNAPAGTNAV